MPANRPHVPNGYGLGRLVSTIGSWAFKPDRYVADLNRYRGRIITSYTAHLNRPRFTVEVPGSPPIYTPQGFPYKLNQDARMLPDLERSTVATFPARPSGLEWHIRAMRFTSPDVKPKDLDIITNATNLTILHQFLSGDIDGYFRMHCELHGEKTLVFNIFLTHDIRIPYIIVRRTSYGQTFEQFNTHEPNGAHPMLSHHSRLMGYKLGGLRFAVSREIDAVVPEWGGPLVFPDAKRREKPLIRKLDEFTMIHTGGQPVPGLMAEMKTSASHNHMSAEKMAQWKNYISTAWFSNIPTIICGVYDGRGYFTRHDMINMEEVGGAWLNEGREAMQKVLLLLQMMREEVKKSKGRRLAFVREEGTPFLKVHELDDRNLRMLPGDVSRMFM